MRRTAPPLTENNRVAYSIDETRAVSGLGRDSIYKLIRAGRLPVRKCGKRTIVLRDDLLACLAALPEGGHAA